MNRFIGWPIYQWMILLSSPFRSSPQSPGVSRGQKSCSRWCKYCRKPWTGSSHSSGRSVSPQRSHGHRQFHHSNHHHILQRQKSKRSIPTYVWQEEMELTLVGLQVQREFLVVWLSLCWRSCLCWINISNMDISPFRLLDYQRPYFWLTFLLDHQRSLNSFGSSKSILSFDDAQK